MYKAKFVALLWILFIEKKIDIIEQNDPKILSKLIVRIKVIIENNSCSAIRSDHKNVFELNPTSKLAHWGPKIRSKPNVRFEGSIENQSCLSI